MMENYALVNKENFVENIIVLDVDNEKWQPPKGLTPIKIGDNFVDIGYIFLEGEFLSP